MTNPPHPDSDPTATRTSTTIQTASPTTSPNAPRTKNLTTISSPDITTTTQ